MMITKIESIFTSGVYRMWLFFHIFKTNWSNWFRNAWTTDKFSIIIISFINFSYLYFSSREFKFHYIFVEKASICRPALYARSTLRERICVRVHHKRGVWIYCRAVSISNTSCFGFSLLCIRTLFDSICARDGVFNILWVTIQMKITAHSGAY